jgi:hypothetical protein
MGDNKVMCDIETIKTDKDDISDKTFSEAKKDRYRNIKKHYISILKDLQDSKVAILNFDTEKVGIDTYVKNIQKENNGEIPENVETAFSKSETLNDYLNEVHKKTTSYFNNDTNATTAMERENEKIETETVKQLEQSNSLLKDIEKEEKESKSFEDEYTENSSITNKNEKFNKIMIYTNYAIFGLVIIGVIYINIAYNFFKEQTKIQIKSQRTQ